MSTKSKTLQLGAIALVAVLFNTVLFYMLNCTGGMLRSHDIIGVEYFYSSDEIALQSSIIESLPADIKGATPLLNQKVTELTEYYYAALYAADNYHALDYWAGNLSAKERAQKAKQLYEDYSAQHINTTPEEAATALTAQIDAYKAVLKQIDYILSYDDYVTGVAENAQQLSQLPLYQENGWLRNNIIKTQQDFYGLNHVTLTPVIEAGYMSLLNYRITDIIALLITLMAAKLLAPSKELLAKKRFGAPIMVWLAGIVSMYLMNMLLSDAFLGLPDYHIALQSLPPFQRCPYLLSCGALLAVCLLFKLAGFVIVFCAVLMLFSSRKKIPNIVIIGIIIIQLAFALYGGEDRAIVLFREINAFSAFSGERFFLRYLNLDIFGMAAPSLPMFTLFLLILLVGMLITTSIRVSSYTKEILAQAQRNYYDEIDRRHEEARKIRHDINNHLLALNLLIERGDLQGAKSYIGEISEQMDLTIMPVRTGCNVLDALICQKIKQAQEAGITVQTEITCSLKDKTISDYDLCGIFGNILDNAMEAVWGTKTPTIKLFISNQMNMLYISCENAFEGEIRRKGNRFLTTKTNTSEHGFGIARVKEIAKAYDGEVTISTENDLFLIEILLNNS